MTDLTPIFKTLTAEEEIIIPPLFGDTPSQTVGGFSATPAELTQGKIKLQGIGERILIGAATAPLTGIGVFMGSDQAATVGYDFRVGDPSGNYIHWDASLATLTIVGSINATSGTLGAVFYTKQYIYTSFESADGWTNGANLDVRLGGSAIQTGNIINTKKNINDEIFGGRGLFFTTKNPGFQCGLQCSAITNQIIYFGAGDLNIGDDTESGFGFKIVNGTLYALHTVPPGGGNPAVEYTTEITGITLTNPNEYKAIYTSNTKIEFYVNNVLKATHTTNLLTSTNDNSPVLMSFSIKNTEAVNKIIYLSYAVFFQDF